LGDDTPRAFVQLMQFQKKLAATSSGDKKKEKDNDNGGGNSSSKKRKREEPNTSAERSILRPKTTAPKTAVESPSSSNAAPKILPGERLSDFAARVDQALPLSGISKKSSHKPSGSHNLPAIRDHRLTKHEKHLRRMQQQWREEEARLREREAEEQEEKEAEREEQLEVWKQWEREAGKTKAKGQKKKKKGKKREGPNDKASNHNQDDDDDDDDDDDNDDPWAKLNERARARRPINPLEVAQAPPQLVKPKEVFKVRGTGGAKVNVANVPAAAGSLRRREELAEERKSIVEEYRRLMAQNRQ
jgi:hypothetical protein